MCIQTTSHYPKRGARTSDHILALKCMIDTVVNKMTEEYLYCCFVDFKAAFDTISRKALVFKLVHLGIGGNLLSLLQDMYKQVVYSIKSGDNFSDYMYIPSYVGVKQDCVLSPLVFNLCTSDLPDMFDGCDPVALHDMNVACLMFADDLVIVSKTNVGLQRALDNLAVYCKKVGSNCQFR
jgi:hypothetical protein